MIKKILLLLFFTPLFAQAQHLVTGTFTPAENFKWGILYQVTPTGTRYTTDTKIDEKGAFAMSLDSTVAAGVYRFVYGVPPEENNFEFIYSGKEDIALSFSEEKGLIFISSDENKTWFGYSELTDTLQKEVDLTYIGQMPDTLRLDSLFKQQNSLFHLFKGSSKGKMAASFIDAYQPYIPKKFIDAKTYAEGRRQHFLKVVRFNNPILQKSGFLLEQSLHFLNDSPALFLENIDGIATNLSDCDPQFQKVFLMTLWEKINDAEQVKAANYLASQYLIPLARTMGDKPLADQLQILINTSIGATAPNFSWETEDKTRQWFHDMEGSEKYVLVFWSSSCSHCLKELPILHKHITAISEEKYKVIAFGLEDDIYDWKNEILRLPQFKHIPGLGKWQNPTGKAYNVSKTPTYYVLDKDMKIVAKPEELEELVNIISEK